MRIDLYTKLVLTVIAGLLGVIALRPYVGPEVVQAQGSFSGVQFTGDANSGSFFDSKTGEVWTYIQGRPQLKRRLTKLGQPMVD
jgi:hypothetical protein